MGMDSVYKLSVVLGLTDNMTGNLSSVTNKVTDSTEKLNKAFGSVQKAGAVMVGVGTALTTACLGTVQSTFDTQNALGELASLGVQDLDAVEKAAKSFSDTWAGTTKSEFISASYDIKSGIASLTDEGVAKFTELAALTGKAQSPQQKRWVLYLRLVMVFTKVHMRICQILNLGRCSQPVLLQRLRTIKQQVRRWQVQSQC